MSRRIAIDMNRVEGDLELDVELTDGVITDAWCKGVLYRGFEQILLGRDSLDSLAITPRICGICGTAHLYAAVLALESAFNLNVPDNAKRIRNICLLAEEVLSDCRQTFLMFAPDLTHERYKHLPDFQAARDEFTPMSGQAYRESILMSKEIVKIVALFGGQWPHSSYMMPGGVTPIVGLRQIQDGQNIVEAYIRWFEKRMLTDSLENWMNISDLDALKAWDDAHPDSVAALFNRLSRAMGFERLGPGSLNLLSYGMGPGNDGAMIRTGGFMRDTKLGQIEDFDQSLITEDVSHAWFFDEDSKARHPFDGITRPDFQPESDAYSWAKAPRYDDLVVQTGPLATLAISGDPLSRDLLSSQGSHTWQRQFARFRRQASSLLHLRELFRELCAHDQDPCMDNQPMPKDGEGLGTLEAARGSLGHWVRIEDGRIAHYQVVTPTAWNASPRDSQKRRGHWEESLIGLTIEDEEDPLEIGHVIRSHDPCLVCTVHMLDRPTKIRITP